MRLEFSATFTIPFALQISAVPEEAPGCPVDFRSSAIAEL
ncbi:MAG TPA: alpha/beta hydrolase, partial [Methylococcaceae bacterium]|nr:alpha/beta hydrolase [Methylococcaceae bacterium]